MAEENVMVEIDEEEDEKVTSSEEEVVVVEEPPKEEEEAEPQEDEKPKAEQEDEVDEEREQIRERRRKEKAERKERREAAIKRDKTELDFLRARNDDLERRISAQEKKVHQTELSGYDAAIAAAAKEVQMAERVIAKAVENNNGEDVTKAMKFRDAAMTKQQQLNQAKQQATQQQPAPPQVDERTMHYAQQFMKENPWYDAQGRDEDSAIVMAIDQALSKDGYNPQTEEYWDELRTRAARRLPERFDDDYDDEPAPSKTRKPRGGPKVGSGKEHAPSSTRKEVYISPERKQALMDAGVWDDPILRQKYVKRYAQYDRENS